MPDARGHLWAPYRRLEGPVKPFRAVKTPANAAHPLTPACGASRDGAGSVAVLAAGLEQVALERLHAVRRNVAADDDHAAEIPADGLPARLEDSHAGPAALGRLAQATRSRSRACARS